LVLCFELYVKPSYSLVLSYQFFVVTHPYYMYSHSGFLSRFAIWLPLALCTNMASSCAL
ncbi:hypothetical protein K435DRAFT_782775, partial [Dendrothele bispora CBS 962.96]